ncbi:hypothetical protein HX889_09225 [Pseudomonas reactans]|nr:hypothetical protein [Pseudomonas reactans]
MEKTFVCLSKSKKNNDYCVAGKVINPDGTIGDWIRPLNQFGAISDQNCLYEDQTYANPLDIIKIKVSEYKPQKFQSENYKIDTAATWIKIDTYSSSHDQLNLLCDEPTTLWHNNHSTASGHYDQISPDEAATIHNSLYFIYVEQIIFITSRWNNDPIKVRAQFTYENITYNLRVTDHKWINYFQDKPIGNHPKNKNFLTISLALDVYANIAGSYHYKVLAEVM